MDTGTSQYMTGFMAVFNKRIKDQTNAHFSWDQENRRIIITRWKNHQRSEIYPVLKNIEEIAGYLNDVLLDLYHGRPNWGITMEHGLPAIFEITATIYAPKI